MFARRRAMSMALGVGATLTLAMSLAHNRKRVLAKQQDGTYTPPAQPAPIVKMPKTNPLRIPAPSTDVKGAGTVTVYTRDQVSQHDGSQTRKDGKPSVWVTYKNNVYDVTDFVDIHPGGKGFIMQAAGGAVDGFWDYWAYHYVSAKVLDMLHTYQIGVLDAHDAVDEADADAVADVYADEPTRPTTQRALLDKPWCSETEVKTLASHVLTPNDAFYVRNHAPVPVVDPKEHRICFSNTHGQSVAYMSVDELKQKYGTTVVTSVLQCAGNRGEEMMEISTTAFSGSPFYDIGPGMIGCANWGGVPLVKVLKDLFPGLFNGQEVVKDTHVVFEGADGYSASTPLERIADPANAVLLVTEMNGEPLPRDHGSPVRVLVPGSIGARSVKWVNSVRVSPDEAEACWNSVYYKGGDGATSLTQMPIQSLILSPVQGQRVAGHSVRVQGIAWGGGSGNAIERVEVSTDLKTWHQAELTPSADQSEPTWAWVRWECGVPALEGEMVLHCRAYDTQGSTQPERPWNPKGYLYNGWHRIHVNVDTPQR